MKKFLTFAAIAIAATGSAFAQIDESVTIDIEATAHVYVPLEWDWHNGQSVLDFGDMERGDQVDIWASQGNGTSAALFWISGDAGDAISVTIPANFTLYHPEYATNPVANNKIVASTYTGSTPKVRVADDPAGFPSGATPLYTPGASINLSADGDGNGTNGDNLGQLYFSVGAIATASATQQRGPYTGTLTINADYVAY